MHPRDDMLTDLVQRRDHRRRRCRRGALTVDEAADVRQPAHQRRHRDGRPPARLGGGHRSPSTPTSGPSSPPTHRSSPTRSRSCCATRRRHRCRAAGRRATSSCTARRSRPARRCCCSPARPAATSASTPTPTASTSTAASTTTCRSATASTSASARRWPAWRAASRSRRRSSGTRSGTVDHDARRAPAHQHRPRLRPGADPGLTGFGGGTVGNLHPCGQAAKGR